ncbi:type I-B CRISPR-associated protein Cas5b [uncultured Methanosphaera sp.]|uniref:type I-B CRISPR-associated protein Cas5b n=1 Tax=uncultured Methanosphaera sp. TaxID=262501 RepID=UPI002804A25D|nr:type I-B CRISPR-associated protein Cas5b [uncultured Methanosphaera sp.]
MNIVAFDIWGDYAYFRRGYTTTSTISYPFPSRTTIAGIISCILGYSRDSYYELFQPENSKIGLKIINPIKNTRINLNYINTKLGMNLSDIEGNGKRTQVPAEFIKDPKYRIYVSLDDEKIMKQLYTLLNEHKSIYTPCLGISECLADFKIIDNKIYTVKPQKDENVSIDSIVLKDSGRIQIEKGKRYGVVKSPGFFNNNRSVSEFLEFYYESKGNPIKLESCEYYNIGEDNVIMY